MKFAFRIKAIHKGGTLEAENDRLIVKGADEVVFLQEFIIKYHLQ